LGSGIQTEFQNPDAAAAAEMWAKPRLPLVLRGHPGESALVRPLQWLATDVSTNPRGTMRTKTLTRYLTIAALMAFTLVADTRGALAGTATTTVAVSATVSNSCTITAAALAFGQYTGILASGTTTFSPNCTNGAAWTVDADKGLNSTGVAGSIQRRLVNGSAFLNYNLFVNSNNTGNFGTTTTGGTTIAGTGSGTAQSTTFYAQIPAQTGTLSGTYNDTVTLTVTF
jgi:spore coat protein U-like protein